MRHRSRQPEERNSRPVPTTRTCTDCGATRPIAEFTCIKTCALSWYGRCREYRARRTRERYWVDPAEREAQKARVQGNRLRQRQSTWRLRETVAPVGRIAQVASWR
jgi:hypothetical protein